MLAVPFLRACIAVEIVVSVFAQISMGGERRKQDPLTPESVGDVRDSAPY